MQATAGRADCGRLCAVFHGKVFFAAPTATAADWKRLPEEEHAAASSGDEGPEIRLRSAAAPGPTHVKRDEEIPTEGTAPWSAAVAVQGGIGRSAKFPPAFSSLFWTARAVSRRGC